jgi:purine-binding chemotaxis protein CheW
MEAEWNRRAIRLARKPVAASSGDQRQVLVLRLGEERYGIELADVSEVLPALLCTPVPGAPPALAGVINFHGEIRPVMNLKFLFGIPPPAGPRMPTPVILLRQQGREIGLQVDRVEQVRQVASGDINVELPTTRYLKGVTPDTLMLLSTEALFTELLKDEFTK